MRRNKLIKGLVLYKLLRRLPGFPLIPLVPAVLLGSRWSGEGARFAAAG